MSWARFMSSSLRLGNGSYQDTEHELGGKLKGIQRGIAEIPGQRGGVFGRVISKKTRRF